MCTLVSIDVVEGTWSSKPADLPMYYLRLTTVGCFSQKMGIYQTSVNSKEGLIHFKIIL